MKEKNSSVRFEKIIKRMAAKERRNFSIRSLANRALPIEFYRTSILFLKKNHF